MKILVACEESQRVCMEFRRLGHEAYSCDVEPCSGGCPEWHVQSDVLPLINGRCSFKTVDGIRHMIDDRWDMIIAFPPCTYLTVAGNRWFDVEKYGDKAIERMRRREEAKRFFMMFANADCERIAIENPVGIMNTVYRKPDQIIQPWMFGHNASKGTCLWLKNLRKLHPTDIIWDKEKRKENQKVGKNGNLLSFDTRDENGKILAWNNPKTAKIRSKTFPGIAKAMAEQWGHSRKENNMSMLDNIKKEAVGTMTKIQTTEEKELEAKLNTLFFLEKDIPKEIAFLKSVMTRGQETTERKGLHASAIITSEERFCYRQQVLSLFYKQKQGEQLSPSLKRIFAEGDAIHEKWQRLFIRAGYADMYDCDMTQHSVRDDLDFTPDIICTIDGVRMICEIKSVNTIQFKNMMKNNKPHPTGKKQLFLYMYLTGIHKGFVLCEDKNTQEFRVNIYEYDEKEVSTYVKRLEQIQILKKRLTESNRMTRRHEKCNNYNCKMAEPCPMREVCWNKEKGVRL